MPKIIHFSDDDIQQKEVVVNKTKAFNMTITGIRLTVVASRAAFVVGYRLGKKWKHRKH